MHLLAKTGPIFVGYIFYLSEVFIFHEYTNIYYVCPLYLLVCGFPQEKGNTEYIYL